jgi:hypothetical protein
MKKLLLLMLLTFTTMTFAAEEDLSFPFTPDSGKYWRYISDRTMGGVSDGQANLERDGEVFFARLTGNVSTRNNGGFIQFRSGISLANTEENGQKIKGVRLIARGNGETYYIFIRTNDTQSYSDYYSASFEVTSNWTVIDLPFNKFVRKRSNNSRLDAKNIRTFGIVAYGRNFASDVSVSTIEFYY